MAEAMKDMSKGDDHARPSRLGRGLAALIGDMGHEQDAPAGAQGSRRLPVAFLKANPKNPRKDFSAEHIDDLARSVKEKGVVQPIIVRPMKGHPDQFEIVAGERRWRAAQKAGLHDVPVLIYELDDKEALEIAIIENVQRADLNALEEAQGYQELIESFKYSQDALAKVIGKSRSHVANTLRLLKLPETVKAYVRSGKLSAGHARTLIGHADPEGLAKRIVELDLSVRESEAVTRKGPARAHKKAGEAQKDADTLELEKALSAATGLKTAIVQRGKEAGELRIRYDTLDELDALCKTLKNHSAPRKGPKLSRV